MRGGAPCEFRVIETSLVTEDELTRILNEQTQQGWIFDGFQFAMREASHRPAMAFAIFRRTPCREPEPSSS